jgi:hypothetical protein
LIFKGFGKFYIVVILAEYMPNILEAGLTRTEAELEELVDCLHSTFSIIAFTDHYKDAKWIWKRTQHIKRRFGELFENYIYHPRIEIHIASAYDTLFTLINHHPGERRKIAEETFYEHLHRDGDAIDEEE